MKKKKHYVDIKNYYIVNYYLFPFKKFKIEKYINIFLLV